MVKLLSLVLSGAVSGCIYSLVASGLVLTYTATGIFNLSYGAVAYVSAVTFYELNTGLHWPIVPSLLAVVLVLAPLLGLALDYAVFRPLSRASESAQIMATVGLLIALPALCTFTIDTLVNWTRADVPTSVEINQVGFPSGVGPVPRHNWRLPTGVTFDSNQLAVVIAAASCAVGLWLLLRHTSLGLRMRAVVDRPDLARTRGVNNAETSRWAWTIGMTLAALAGVVGAPVLGSLGLNIFTTIVFVAAAAAVVGALRSIPLAFVGGLLLGIIQNLVVGYADFARNIRGFNAAAPFLLLLVGLVVLARDRTRRGGSAEHAAPPEDHLTGMPPWRRFLPWIVAICGLVVYVLLLADQFWCGVIGMGLALSLIYLSFVVVTGLGGLVTLAQAAVAACSAMSAGMLMERYHLPFLLAVVLGVAIGAAIGVLVALPALRLGGIPLALATLALAFLSDLVLTQWDWFRKDQGGWTIDRLRLGVIDLDDPRTFALTMLLIVGVVVFLISNLHRSATGRAIMAVRASELAAQSSGISSTRAKLSLFATAAAIAGFGGVMLSMYRGSVTSTSFTVADGLLWLAAVVLFGIRRPGAAVLAGIVTAVSPEILHAGFHWPRFIPSFFSWDGTRISEIPMIMFGLGAIQLSRNPDGVLAIAGAQSRARRTRRAARHHAPNPRLRSHAAPRRAAAAPVNATTTTGTSALTLHGVRSGYGEIEILHGVDLALPSATITALVGANGSGKSTLCSTISGLVPLRSGSVALGATDISTLAAHRRARAGVRVAPESRGIFPGLSVRENLDLVLDPAGRALAFDRFPRLAQRAALLAGSLSGGEQQMLALAPLLGEPPAVLIADEPTLGLAPLIVDEVMHVFTELRDRGVAVLLVEEKVRDVLEIADTVAVLELGNVVWYGARGEVDEHRLAASYLGSAAT